LGALEPLLLIHANVLEPMKYCEVECSFLPPVLEGKGKNVSLLETTGSIP
jgi:hypothetical protein